MTDPDTAPPDCADDIPQLADDAAVRAALTESTPAGSTATAAVAAGTASAVISLGGDATTAPAATTNTVRARPVTSTPKRDHALADGRRPAPDGADDVWLDRLRRAGDEPPPLFELHDPPRHAPGPRRVVRPDLEVG